MSGFIHNLIPKFNNLKTLILFTIIFNGLIIGITWNTHNAAQAANVIIDQYYLPYSNFNIANPPDNTGFEKFYIDFTATTTNVSKIDLYFGYQYPPSATTTIRLCKGYVKTTCDQLGTTYETNRLDIIQYPSYTFHWFEYDFPNISLDVATSSYYFEIKSTFPVGVTNGTLYFKVTRYDIVAPRLFGVRYNNGTYSTGKKATYKIYYDDTIIEESPVSTSTFPLELLNDKVNTAGIVGLSILIVLSLTYVMAERNPDH